MSLKRAPRLPVRSFSLLNTLLREFYPLATSEFMKRYIHLWKNILVGKPNYSLHDDAYTYAKLFRLIVWASIISIPLIPIVFIQVHRGLGLVMLDAVCSVFLMANINIFLSRR